MAKKEITNVFKIQAPGGIATPAPPIGPALGQYGVNPGETCTNWTIDYHLVPAAGATAGSISLSYQINKVTTVGAGHSSC